MKYQRTVIAGDFHVPYHDKNALNLFYEFLKWYKPEVLVISGDYVDCESLSKFSHDPISTGRLKEEIEKGKVVLKKIVELTPKCKRYFVFGNHDSRLQKYLCSKAPELVELLLLEDLLEVRHDWEVINNSLKENYVQIGDIYVGHWDRVSKFSAYTVKNIMADKGVNIVQSHVHRLGYHTTKFLDRTIEGWEIGCMCDLNPKYLPNANWQTGWGIIDPFNSGKDFSFTLATVRRYGKKIGFKFGTKTFQVEVQSEKEGK